MIAEACAWLAKHLDGRIITRGWEEGEPYLERFYIFRRRMLPFRAPKWLPGIYLHHFLVDDDQALHNHPWSAKSLILSGGYKEWKRDPYTGEVAWRVLLPGEINSIEPDDFHRVELLDKKKGAWTLFFYGSKSQSWGFWDETLQKVIDWREHRHIKMCREIREVLK